MVAPLPLADDYRGQRTPKPIDARRPLPREQPRPLPSSVQRAIDQHRTSGEGMKLMWAHPELANELHKYYGDSGQIMLHDAAQHGELGSSQATATTEGKAATGLATAQQIQSSGSGQGNFAAHGSIEPPPLPGAGEGGGGGLPPPPQAVIPPGGMSGGEDTNPDSESLGLGGAGWHQGLPPGGSSSGYRMIGPGVAFGSFLPSGEQLAYATYSHFDPQSGQWIPLAQDVNGNYAPGQSAIFSAPSQAFANDLALGGQQGFSGDTQRQRDK